MQVDRNRLLEQFSMLDDGELLRRYRSGDLTPLAADLAAAELADRGIDPGPETADEPAVAPGGNPLEDLFSEPTSPRGDIVCLVRLRGLMEAQILCARLRAEGIPGVCRRCRVDPRQRLSQSGARRHPHHGVRSRCGPCRRGHGGTATRRLRPRGDRRRRRQSRRLSRTYPETLMATPVSPQMVSTTNEIPGYRVTRPLGIVRGITVRSRSMVGNLGAALQTMVGGNISDVHRAVRKGPRGGVRADAAARRGDGRQCGRGHALRRQRGGPGRHRGTGLRHGGAGSSRES